MTSLPTEPALPPTSTSTHSLAAAATLNAGMQNDARSRRGSERRRSSVRMSLTLNDPTLPSPGELQMSPRQHHRAPSLSEIAQDMEAEQEMHVNRLLSMIRHQQAQIQTLTSQSSAPPSSASAIDDSTPTSERSLAPSANTSATHIPSAYPAPPRSRRTSRNPSYRSSREGSPALRVVSGTDGEAATSPPVRDEAVFYQAEAAALQRENQMLRLRLRELERQYHDLHHGVPEHAPHTPSNLHSPPINTVEGGGRTLGQ